MSSAPVLVMDSMVTGSDEIALREPLYVFAAGDALRQQWQMKLGDSAQRFGLAANAAREILLSIDGSWAHMCYVRSTYILVFFEQAA